MDYCRSHDAARSTLSVLSITLRGTLCCKLYCVTDSSLLLIKAY